jgi:DNA-binding SARP family transcriptional activator
VESLPRLKIYLLGEFRAFLDDRPLLPWPSRKGKFIFAYLVMNHRRKICRDILMEKFWPNSTPESARNCLNVALHGVRRLLHSVDDKFEHILFKDECYFINPVIELWTDVEEFKKTWKEGQKRERENRVQDALQAYELAAEIYMGDLMEENLYEDWLILEREHLKEVYLLILDKVSNYYSLDGQPHTAIDLCEKMLEKDNCQEGVYRRLMTCYYRLGLKDKALRQFRRCTDVMERELEAEPTTETIRLYKRIKMDRDTDEDQR